MRMGADFFVVWAEDAGSCVRSTEVKRVLIIKGFGVEASVVAA